MYHKLQSSVEFGSPQGRPEPEQQIRLLVEVCAKGLATDNMQFQNGIICEDGCVHDEEV